MQEAYEQLELIESMLIDEAMDIHALFRNFHTLKGGFNAASLESLSAIAHLCEDVLSIYRDSKDTLPAAFVDLLYEVISYLRNGLVFAEQNQSNPKIDEQLREKINSFTTAQQKNSDEHPYQQLVLQAKTGVPAIALSLQTGANNQQLLLSLTPLAKAAKENKLLNLSKAVSQLIELLKKEGQRELILLAVARCFEQLYLIEDIYQIDLSLQLAAQLSSRQLQAAFIQQLEALQKQLNSEVNEADLLLVQHYLAARAWFPILKQWRYATHMLKKLKSSEHANKVLSAVKQMIDLMLEPNISEQLIIEQTEQTLERLRLSLSGNTFQDSRDDALFQAILKESPQLTSQDLSGLSDKQKHTLTQALADGLHIYVLHLDFKQQELAEKVFALLDKQVQIVHSFTIFEDGSNAGTHTLFGFLCASKQSFERICKLILAIDVDLQVLKNSTIKPKHANSSDALAVVDQLSQETSRALSNVRVEGHILEAVIDQISNIKVQLNQLNHLLESQLSDNRTNTALQNVLNPINEQQLALLAQVDKAQSLSLQLRVVSIDFALRRFHSFVRMTANKLGKKTKLVIEGGETKVDKSLLDALAEPIAHLVRNAIDHGIETTDERRAAGKDVEGTILIKATEKNGKIFLNIVDDGRGLDQQAILQRAIELNILQDQQPYDQATIFQQIFFPGFSMAEKVSEISGRGVGMDVVKNSIVKVGGTVAVSSDFGYGVDVELCLPISAQIQKVLLIEQSGQLYALPERWLIQLCAYEEVFNIQQTTPYILYQQQLVPLYFMDHLFCLSSPSDLKHAEIIILQHENYTIALAVEKVLTRTEVLLKQQDDYLKHITGISAASILSDGRIALVIDGLGLFQLALGNQIHGLKA